MGPFFNKATQKIHCCQFLFIFVKCYTLFHFLKEVNYIKSFLSFLFYLERGNMYIFGLSFVLFIQKNSLVKEFKLVTRGFGQKIRNTLRNSRRQIWKQNRFYINLKKNTGVSFTSCSFPMVIHSIDLYNNASQPPFFLKGAKEKETKLYFSFSTSFLSNRDHYKQVSSSFFHF